MSTWTSCLVYKKSAVRYLGDSATFLLALLLEWHQRMMLYHCLVSISDRLIRLLASSKSLTSFIK